MNRLRLGAADICAVTAGGLIGIALTLATIELILRRTER